MQKVFEAILTEKGKGGVRCIMVSSLGTVYTGKAICSDNDDFSMKIGMELAEKRARLKQLNRIYNGMDKKKDKLLQMLEQVERKEDRLFDQIMDLEDDIATLEVGVSES